MRVSYKRLCKVSTESELGLSLVHFFSGSILSTFRGSSRVRLVPTLGFVLQIHAFCGLMHGSCLVTASVDDLRGTLLEL